MSRCIVCPFLSAFMDLEPGRELSVFSSRTPPSLSLACSSIRIFSLSSFSFIDPLRERFFTLARECSASERSVCIRLSLSVEMSSVRGDCMASRVGLVRAMRGFCDTNGENGALCVASSFEASPGSISPQPPSSSSHSAIATSPPAAPAPVGPLTGVWPSEGSSTVLCLLHHTRCSGA